MDAVRAVLQGERLAIARLITKIENQDPDGFAVLDQLFPYTGKAHLIGVTGSPGSGKSSLVNELVKQLRSEGIAAGSRRVGVVAVDPISPFSGGALLGDRVRMRGLMGDPDVFIRSMASRGALGGLAYTTGAVVQVLDAAGFDQIVIETVGAGQTEVDIARLAHTVIVVEAPGMGDDIQAIKAGILEIADILVVNKADHAGAENTMRALENMLELARQDMRDTRLQTGCGNSEPAGQNRKYAWSVPVMRTIATTGDGIEALREKIADHIEYLGQTNERKHRDRWRICAELDRLIQDKMVAKWKAAIEPGQFETVVEQLVCREISPQIALDILTKKHKDE